MCSSAYGGFVLSHLPVSGKLFSTIPLRNITFILLSDSVLSSWMKTPYGHLITKDIHLLLHCTIQSFLIGTCTLGIMISADFLRQALIHTFRKKTFYMSVRLPRIRALTFHLMSALFTPTVPNSYKTLTCLAALPMVICLI